MDREVPLSSKIRPTISHAVRRLCPLRHLSGQPAISFAILKTHPRVACSALAYNSDSVTQPTTRLATMVTPCLKPSSRQTGLHRDSPFIAEAEVTQWLKDKTRVVARISELSARGCYVDTVNPFPLDTELNFLIRYGCSMSASCRVK